MLKRWLEKHESVRDSAGYSLGWVYRLGVSAVVGIALARYLGPSELGFYSFAVSVFTFLSPLPQLGMRSLVVRNLSTGEDWRPMLASTLGSQVFAAILASAIGAAVLVASRGTNASTLAITLALIPLPILGMRYTLEAALEAWQAVRRIVLIGMLASTIGGSIKIVGVVFGAPTWFFAAAISLEAAVSAIGFIRAVPARARLGGLLRYFNRSIARRMVSEGWPLLVASFAAVLYMKADLVMLGLLSSDTETGIYTAAARLSEVWYYIPMSALTAVAPRLARAFKSGDRDRYYTMTQRFMTSAFLVAVGAAGLTLLGGNQAVVWIYGSEFAGAGPVLQIHILAAPFAFLGVAASQWFIDRGLTREVMVRSAIGAGVNIGLNLVLIPGMGAMGAAVATLVSYALSGVLLNVIGKTTRPILKMQFRALRLAWNAPAVLPAEE